jgi:hypothetical protein
VLLELNSKNKLGELGLITVRIIVVIFYFTSGSLFLENAFGPVPIVFNENPLIGQEFLVTLPGALSFTLIIILAILRDRAGQIRMNPGKDSVSHGVVNGI